MKRAKDYLIRYSRTIVKNCGFKGLMNFNYKINEKMINKISKPN